VTPTLWIYFSVSSHFVN